MKRQELNADESVEISKSESRSPRRSPSKGRGGNLETRLRLEWLRRGEAMSNVRLGKFETTPVLIIPTFRQLEFVSDFDPLQAVRISSFGIAPAIVLIHVINLDQSYSGAAVFSGENRGVGRGWE